jgi:FlaA1/EpsC-like NDP-sugar epimerase
MPRLVRTLGIDHVVITIAAASRNEIRRIVTLCEQIPIKVQIIPGLYEILQGNVEVSRVRDLQIEDLLGREPVRLDEHAMSEFLAGKVVMVTGAGGSIGSELARQIARFRPSRLLLVERGEFGLFNIDRDLRERWPRISIIPIVSDVSDEVRVRAIFETHRPQVVLHAAAHKHVPLMEQNGSEAVKNNVLATKTIGQIAGECRVEAFVMISTDKAVRPTSMMGAAKRVAELVVQDLDRRFATRYVAVRFGNVIGSTGSVIPIFREQIRKGGPVTVTHPDMVRYFMTIPEAAQLVLQAGAMGEGGEIFVLDMGQPVKIIDLAKDTIALSGLKPFEDIDIVFTGIRPGEKLFEELEVTDECLTKTRHPKIYIGKIASYPEEIVRSALERLNFLAANQREDELRDFLGELLPESQLSNHSSIEAMTDGFADKPLPDLEEQNRALVLK